MTSASPESVGMSSDRLARLGPVMQRFIDDYDIAGISTIVSRRGEIVYTDERGHQDREADIPLSADTIHRIYSMTKPVVSTALMMLHEEGAFQLEQPVAAFLPAFADTPVLLPDGTLEPQHRPMEIRELLMHTSGLTYDFLNDFDDVAQQYRDAQLMFDASRPLEQVIDALAEIPLAFQPGAQWHYSLGIDVAARLVEVMSGQRLADFLEERIFAPLGMIDTGFGVDDAKLDRLSAMYGLPDLMGDDYSATGLMEAALAGFNERIDVSATYPTDSPEVFNRGGVGLFSTGPDYWRFAQMLLNGGELDGERLLSRKTLELMHMNHLPEALLPLQIMGEPQRGLGFGLGSRSLVDVAASAGPGSVGEFGWAGAASTYYWVDPVEEIVGVLMTQYMTGISNPSQTFRSIVYSSLID